MNYTQTKQALEIVRYALSLPSTEARRPLADTLRELSDQRQKIIAARRATRDRWGATNSEKDFVLTLRAVAELLSHDAATADSELAGIADMLRQRTPPIRVAFFTQEFFLWPSFQTIWEHFQTLDNVETSIVYTYSNGAGVPLKNEDYWKNIFQYRDAGYPILEMEQYNLSEESPDLVLYMKPYYNFRASPPKFYINEIERHTPYTAFISYCLDVQGGNKLIKFFYAMPAFYHMWRIIGYSRFYMDMIRRYGYRDADNAVMIGHPKFDCTHKALIERAYQRGDWRQKIAGRPVVLWNTHFSVEENGGVSTYLIWKDMMFDYFERHRDIVLLWRPHPLFWSIIRQQKGFNGKEFDAFVRSLKERDNVIVDDTGDYRYAFSMSDALISDAATFLVEFGATGLPVLYTKKQGGEFIINEDYLANMETATKAETIIAFLERVKRRDTSGQEARRQQFESMFGKCDGNNGRRICEYLLREMESDCVARARRMAEGKG